MSKIPKLSQSIFGQGRSAQENVRQVAIPNPHQGLGSAISASSDGLSKVFNGAMALAQEGQQLALEEAQVAFNAAITKRFDEEVFSLSGEAAAGSTSAAERILREEEARQLERLSNYGGGASRQFRMYAAKSAPDRMSSAVRYGRGQVKQARIEAGNIEMKQGAEVYATTGSESSFNGVLASFDRTWEAQFGYIANGGALAKFDEHLKDGFVNYRGEKLRIVDAIKPGDRGVISREEANRLRTRLDAERQRYEKSRQDQIDLLTAKRVDKFLEWGQLDQAQNYVASVIQGGYRPSDNALSLINSRLEVFGRNKIVADEASVCVQRALATGAQDKDSFGGRYHTPETDRAFAEMRAQLVERAAQDTTGMGKRLLGLFDMQARAQLQLMDANYKADWESTVKDMKDKGLFNKGMLAARGTFISNMPDSPIKRVLAQEYSKAAAAEAMSRAEKIKNNPEVKANREALINGIKVNIAANNLKIVYKTVGGEEKAYPIDVNNDDQFEMYLDRLGLTDDERVALQQYRQSPRIESVLAATYAAEALDALAGFKDKENKGYKYFDASNVWKVLPGLEQEIQRILRYRPDIDFRKGSNDTSRQWLKDQIRNYIIAQEYTDPVTKRVIKLRDQLDNMVDKYGNVDRAQLFTPERMYELSRTPEQLKLEAEYFRDLYTATAGPDADTNQPYNADYDGAKAAARRGLVPIKTADGDTLYVPKGKAEAHRKRENDEKERREAVKKAQEDYKATILWHRDMI